MWAISETMVGDHRSAERIYLQLLRRSPDNPLGWLGLAGAAMRLDDRTQLARAMARAYEDLLLQLWQQKFGNGQPAAAGRG